MQILWSVDQKIVGTAATE